MALADELDKELAATESSAESVSQAEPQRPPAPPSLDSALDRELSAAALLQQPPQAEPPEPERGTLTKILDTLDAPRAFIARKAFNAIGPGFQVPEDQHVTGSNLIHAVSQAFVPGPRRSKSRAEPGVYVEQEDIPTSTLGKVAEFMPALAVDVAIDPLTYVGVGGLTKAGKAARGGAEGVKLAATWGEQAAQGQRALVQFGGREVVRGQKVLEGASALSSALQQVKIKDVAVANEAAEWLHRVFGTTVGLSPVRKTLVEWERMSASEQRYFVNRAIAQAGKDVGELDRIAGRLGISPAELHQKLLNVVDAPKAKVAALDDLLRDGTLTADEHAFATKMVEHGRALFARERAAGVPVSELGRSAFEADVGSLNKEIDRWDRKLTQAKAARDAIGATTERLESVRARAHEVFEGMRSGAIDRVVGTAELNALAKDIKASNRDLSWLKKQPHPAAIEAKRAEAEAALILRTHHFNETELNYIPHIITPEALTEIAAMHGGGDTVQTKTLYMLEQLQGKRTGQGFQKARRITDMPVTEINQRARELGLLSEGVNLFSEDPAHIMAARAVASAKATTASELLTRVGKEFGQDIPGAKYLDRLQALEDLSKQIGDMRDVRAMGVLKKEYDLGKYESQAAMERRYERDARKLIGEMGGDATAPLDDIRHDLMRARGQAYNIPEGHVLMREGPLAGKALPAEVAEWAKKFSASRDPEIARGFFRDVYMPIQSWWKSWTLAPRPAYHIRNMVGNLWLNYLGGVTNPRDYIAASMIQAGASEGRIARAVKSVGGTLGANVEGDIGGMTYREVRDLAERHGIIGNSELKDLSENLARAPFDPKALQQAVSEAARKGDPAKLRDYLPFLGGNSSNNRWLQAGMVIGNTVEENAKLAHFVSKLRDGWDVAKAAESVKKHLFDYQSYTDAERKIRTVLPFYKFTRSNIPLELENLVAHPEKFARIAQARNEIQSGEQVPEALLPRWARDALAVQMGRDEKNPKAQAIATLASYWPGADLQKVWGLGEQLSALASMVSPLLKLPAELITNVDLFKTAGQRRIVNIDEGAKTDLLGGRIDPRLAHTLRSLIMVNELDRWNPGNIFGESPTEEHPSGRGALVNLFPLTQASETRHREEPTNDPARLATYLTGLKINSVDLEREAVKRHSQFGRDIQRIKGEIRVRAGRGDNAGAAEMEKELERVAEEYLVYANLYEKHGIKLPPGEP